MIRSVILLLAFAAVLSTIKAPACGPFFEDAVFESDEVPPPVARYDQGQIGIVKGTYRVYRLIDDWRALSGKPAIPPTAQRKTVEGTAANDPNLEWVEARASITGDKVDRSRYGTRVDAYRSVPGSDFQTFENCLEPAFATAAATLRARASQFGPTSDGVRRWIRAQDAVFANCSKGTVMVDPPEPGLPALLAADRQYQRAAAAFYAGDFARARQQWLAIAQDSQSPWSSWSRYLAARCLVREATLGTVDRQPELLAKAESELIAAATGKGAPAESAKRVSDFVAAKLRPVATMTAYARALEGSRPDRSNADNLVHIWSVLDEKQLQPGTGSELLDWLFAMRAKMPVDEIVSRWRRTHLDTWLVAALQTVDANSPNAAELLDAAAKVNPASSAYPTAAWARVRISSAKDAETRRALLDAVLPELQKQIPGPAINFFLRERFAVVRTFDEFLAYAPRKVAAVTSAGIAIAADSDKQKDLLDEDATNILNRQVPVSRWLEIIEARKWTPDLRDRLTRAAFVRALASGDEKVAPALSKAVRAGAPETTPLLAAYESAPDAESRNFAAAWALMKLPGLQPDMRAGFDRREDLAKLDEFRDNWWCPSAEKDLPVSSWLSEEERARAKKESDAAGSTLAFITPVVMQWVEKHGGDARAPEALANIVRVSRYGCRDASTGKYSKQAFTLLHKKYPTSTWAKQTPYWFGAP